MTINILKTESFSPLGPAIKKPIAEKPFTPEQVRPGVFKGADGKLYTDFKANETPTVFHPPKQQVPSALGDGWIEWKGGECPVEAGTRIVVRFRKERQARPEVINPTHMPRTLRWSHSNDPAEMEWDIVDYRVLA